MDAQEANTSRNLEQSESDSVVDDEVQRAKRKRRHSQSVETPSQDGVPIGAKDADAEEEEQPPSKCREVEVVEFQLEQFSDEVLYEIFKHLDSWSLMALMNCSARFHTLILDHRFWTEIDLSQEPLPLGILETVLERTHNQTISIKLRGPPTSQHVDGEIQQFNKTLVGTFARRCTELRVLELRGITIDFRNLRILDFPKSLQRLIFHDCNVKVQGCVKSIFAGIETHLKELKELGIEYSEWFEPYYIMIFSKVPALRWLSLKGCPQLTEFVPYGSMAARFGFKQLEVLDMRFTPINDSDLQCFNAVLTLKEILLDCPEDMRFDDHTKQVVREEPEYNSGCFDEVPSGSATTCSAVPGANLRIAIAPPNSRFHVSQFHNRSPGGAASVSSPSSSVSFVTVSANSSAPPSTLASTSFAAAAASSSSSSSTSSTSSASSSSSNAAASSDASPSTSQANKVQSSPEPQAAAPDGERGEGDGGEGNGDGDEGDGDEGDDNGGDAANPNPNAGGNHHGIGRPLPRSDRVLFIDWHNWRRPIVMRGPPRRPPGHPALPANHIDQVLNHPLFWDMINPLGRVANQARAVVFANNGEDAAAGGEGGAAGRRRSRCYFFNRIHNIRRYAISDRGICCFGRSQNPVDQRVVWLGVGNRPNDNSIQRLRVRNYKLVTDVSLQHLVQCSPQLVFLDLSGTSVTREGVQRFQDQKPECQIIAEHLDAADNANGESVIPPVVN